MSKKIMKSVAIFGTMALVSIPMIAQPIQQKIEAMINPTVEYTLNGEDILDETTTITYKDKNYVSVADLSKALGLDVKFVDGTVVLTESTPQTELTKSVDPTTTSEVNTPEAIEIIGATVIAIDTESNQVTILPAEKENTVQNYIVLNVGEETTVSEGLAVGDLVNVKHSPMMTFSIPAQTPAIEITKVTEEATLPESITIESATIKEIDLENGQITILVEGTEDSPMNYLILNVSDETTSVRHEFNKMAYRLESLEEGMKISVKHSTAVTASLPPQTAASEIVILQDKQ